jgi:glycosyltransferase involved in cell wall biosynthesis
MKKSMKSDEALNMATVVFMDKSHVLAGAERCLCVLTEHLDKARFHTIIAADYPLPHHAVYQRSGVEVQYRTTGMQWWMGTDRWHHPPRGTDAIKRMIFTRQLRNMMAACDARILHVNLLSLDSHSDLAAARHMGMRTVGHVRSLLSQRHLDRRCLELCDAVICISDYVAREITGLTEASRIERIYCPVSVSKTIGLEERNNAKSELGINSDALVISSVAMLDPRKGHDVAILAFAKLSADFPNAILLIVGGAYVESGNTERGRLQKIATDSGIGSRVVFCGYVSEMRKVYAASDIVLALSKDGEAFGRVAVEAAAHGRVAIATAAGATPELIKDGVTGFLVPPNDPAAVVACCRRVLADGEGARRIGVAGMEHVARKFDPDIIARQVAAVYDRLLQL